MSRLASTLTDGNAAGFLEHVDHSMPGYAALEQDAYALVGQAEVGCSIEILRDEGDARSRSLQLDWVMDVTGKTLSAPTERRQKTIHVKLELRRKAWVVTSLEPVSFFAPPKP